MIDTNTLALFRDRYKSLTADGRGDNHNFAQSLTLGLVVNTDDPLEEGRLQIFCPALNDSPKKLQHLPWCAYVTPYGGSVNNKNFTRGTGDGTPTSDGAIHYGFWGVADLGAHVLVGCIDSDPRRRFWIGCIPEHQETHTQFNGRFDWSSKNGTPDGPLTSTKHEIQPLYDNWTKAFIDRASSEWKSRGADYQAMAVSVDGNGAPSKIKGDEYLDESYQGMSSHEKDEWVAAIMGSHGYDWSGYKGVGAFKASRVFGMSTPGFHSFSMDDRPFNSRIKLRTASGHMLLMDDTNERIYLMTNKGKNWVEMDSNGNIDVYAENRVSIHSESDLNLTAGGDIRMYAGQGIHLYAGHTADGQGPPLGDTPNDGEIRIQSEYDTHMVSLNHRQKSYENTYSEVGINHYSVVKGSSFTDVTDNINVRTLTGDYIKSITRDMLETISGSSKRFSYGTSAVSSVGDNETHSLAGGVTIGSKADTTIKAAGGNVGIQATNGNVSTKGSDSEMQVGSDGVSVKSPGNVAIEGGKISATVKSKNTAPVDISSVPDNNCALSTTWPSWSTSTDPRVLSNSEAVDIAYAAGWRGKDLTMAVAVLLAESSGNTVIENSTLNNATYGPCIGLYQIRTLNSGPKPPGDYDYFRNNENNQLLTAKGNAQAAYILFNKSPAGQWTIGKFESIGNPTLINSRLQVAATAVAAKCGGMTGTSMPMGGFLPSAAVGGTSLILSDTIATLQSAVDVEIKTISSHFNSYNELVNKLNTNIIKTTMYGYGTGLIVDKLTSIVSGFSIPMSFDLGCLASDLFNNVIPSSLLSIVGDIQNLKSMLENLGFPNLQLSIESLKSELTAEMLSALGLPNFDLNSILNPMSAGCGGGVLSQIGELSKAVNVEPIAPVEIPDFREVVHKIFEAS